MASEPDIDSLRRAALRARRSLTDEERQVASRTIADAVTSSPAFRRSTRIGCYLPLASEVDTHRIIDRAWRANKRVFVPVIAFRRKMIFCELRPESTLRRNSMGVWEARERNPVAATALDLVITPLAAFDQHHQRIGLGGGYYDRCFAFKRQRRHWHSPRLIGVGFVCQQVDVFTANPWDIPLSEVFSA